MALWNTGGQFRAFFVLVAIIIVCGDAIAGDQADGNDLPDGVTLIQAEEVIRLARDHHDLILIDSRPPADREMGYIEDSVALPDDQTTCESLSAISPDTNRPLLFYCNGDKCARSHNAVQKASACGYSQLYWFKGGYEEWQEKHFPVLRSR